ncbi:alpha/beta hydrolase [Streptacidiphilus sp. N1-12]|uniref:Alpha/beta hydrolase n=2 Tax=Streptacidiphilus alkalitolerans TaxID=3342712 RepID=A0ABV6X5P7_9ACTN
MSLTGTPFFVLTIALVVLTVAALVLVWNRIPGPTPARIAARVGLTVFSQVAAVVMVLVYVNNSMGPFYDTWGSLFGANAEVQLPSAEGRPVGADGNATGTAAQKLVFTKYSSDVLRTTAVGPDSRIKGELFVWLPPQYNDPAYAHTRFPVLELLPGTPGVPQTWFGTMRADRAMARLMAEGKVKPMILVSARMNMFGGSRDSGCADLPGSYRTATWLGRDVPALVKKHFRAADDGRKWAIMGYSAGGYCAANVALHYPKTFHAAVSMSGYNAPLASVVARDPQLAAANNPLLQLRNQAVQPDLVLLAMGSRQDPGTVGDATALVRALHQPRTSQVLTLAKGQHDTGTFIAEMTPGLVWVSQQIAR